MSLRRNLPSPSSLPLSLPLFLATSALALSTNAVNAATYAEHEVTIGHAIGHNSHEVAHGQSYGQSQHGYQAPQPTSHVSAPFEPIAPALPHAPHKGESACDYTNRTSCAVSAPVPSHEVTFIRAAHPAPQPVQQVVHQPVQQVVQQPVQQVVQQAAPYVVNVTPRPVVTVTKRHVAPVKVVKVKQQRVFSDFWSYIGLGATYRTVTIPSDKGDASKFNFYAADVRGGIMWKKFLGIEARLGLSGGGEPQPYACGAGYKCDLSLSAPQTAGVYARGSVPIGRIAPYAIVGAAYKNYKADLTDHLGTSSEEFSLWGLSYGAGIEVEVSKGLNIGAEYLRYGHDDHGFGINARYIF